MSDTQNSVELVEKYLLNSVKVIEKHLLSSVELIEKHLLSSTKAIEKSLPNTSKLIEKHFLNEEEFKEVFIMTKEYFYHGTLIEVTEDFFVLRRAWLVLETGKLGGNQLWYGHAEKVTGKTFFVPRNDILCFGDAPFSDKGRQ
jgi:hypothetical protein